MGGSEEVYVDREERRYKLPLPPSLPPLSPLVALPLFSSLSPMREDGPPRRCSSLGKEEFGCPAMSVKGREGGGEEAEEEEEEDD